MAVYKTEGGIVEKQPTLAEASKAQGQNTPTSPLGAAAIQGSTAKQQDMAGTPNQTEARLKSLVREQAPETLSAAERYTPQKQQPTSQAQEAKDKAETLKQLGPVQSRVQALIEQRLQQAQGATAALGVNEEAIKNIQDVDQRAEAEAAFTSYLQSPTEANLQKIYDAVGSSALEDIAIYFQGAPEAIKQAIAPQIVGKATLAELSLDQLGTSLADISAALGVDEATLQGMTLDELNAEIDALQAAELNQTEQLTATLYSPTATPQQKKAAIDQLKQLGMAGIPGTEEAVQLVQDQIAGAQTIEVAGREMTLEQALSDEGLSSLISQASYDDTVLNQLKSDPRYAGIAEWVEQNKEALMSLATEYEGEAQDFLGVQEEYRQARSSLGEGADDLLSTILGGDLADSVLSSEWQNIQGQLEASELYSAVLEDDVLREDLKASPEIAKAMIDNGLSFDEINEAVRIKEAAEADPYMADLLGEDGYPTTKEGVAELKDKLDRIEAISPNVLEMGRGVDGISLDTLEDIDASDDPEGIFADIEENKAIRKQLENLDTREDALDSFFGSNDWSANDLNWAIKNAPKETVDNILAIFDADGDGKISEEETQSPDIVPKIKELLGDNLSLDDIVAEDGEYDPAGIAERLMGINVDKSTFERAIGSQIENSILEKEREASDAISSYEAKKNEIKDSGNYATLSAQFTGSNGAELKADMQRSVYAIKRGSVNLPVLDQMKELTLENASHNMFRVRSALAEAKKKAASGNYPNIGSQIEALDNLHRTLIDMTALQEAEESIASLDKRIATQNSTLKTLASQRQGVGSMNEIQLTDLASLLGIM